MKAIRKSSGRSLHVGSLCDIRICGQSSRFGVPINRLGLTVDYDELQMLTSLIGKRRTLEILLEGRIFDADEAQNIGLVTRVVPDNTVTSEALDTADRISRSAPLVNRMHKKFLRRMDNSQPLSEAEKEEAFTCFESEDYKIGQAAFKAKQVPVFYGR